mmetsp:Transcript_26974/g.74177  ORF Transcript_26974/g.74177 Transcript_26974/m.74177 type:complete len:208 (-) Transcript_26974:396-1019(-)
MEGHPLAVEDRPEHAASGTFLEVVPIFLAALPDVRTCCAQTAARAIRRHVDASKHEVPEDGQGNVNREQHRPHKACQSGLADGPKHEQRHGRPPQVSHQGHDAAHRGLADSFRNNVAEGVSVESRQQQEKRITIAAACAVEKVEKVAFNVAFVRAAPCRTRSHIAVRERQQEQHVGQVRQNRCRRGASHERPGRIRLGQVLCRVERS